MGQMDNKFKRSAGILLPVSSLPSKYGIGNFGEEARRWIDFLHAAGQSYWQILPLSPTGYGDSPYQSFSAFAGNSYFIDFEALYEEGLLDKEVFSNIRWGRLPDRVDYAALYEHREQVLRKAFLRFEDHEALEKFEKQNYWLKHYGLYMVIKASQEHLPWMKWKKNLRTRHPETIEKILKENAEDIRYHTFIQYQFDRGWRALRAYAKERNVQIIGDIPIYVSLDSADTWANPGMYQLNEKYLPTEVSGCPPDSFSADGQVWGNPLYNWEDMAKTGHLWWIERLRKNFDLYDVVRLDHFRGLESYFAIPYGDKSAARGVWKPGSGTGFIDAIDRAITNAKIIAEDLGYLTDAVYDLLKYSGYPGMKLIQYAFDDREAGDYTPYRYGENTVVYPGTHDNDTLKGWSRNAPPSCIKQAMEYTGTRRKKDLPRAMIRLTLQTASALAVIPMQDWLGLDSRARLNTPSTVGGSNWCWRLRPGQINDSLVEDIAKLTQLYGR